jgi:hypothetical protein
MSAAATPTLDRAAWMTGGDICRGNDLLVKMTVDMVGLAVFPQRVEPAGARGPYHRCRQQASALAARRSAPPASEEFQLRYEWAPGRGDAAPVTGDTDGGGMATDASSANYQRPLVCAREELEAAWRLPLVLDSDGHVDTVGFWISEAARRVAPNISRAARPCASFRRQESRSRARSV